MTTICLKNHHRKHLQWARHTHLCHSNEVGDDGGPLRSGGLAEHHQLNPLGDAVEERDETLQYGVIHRAAMHHKAVIVLKLRERRGEKKQLSNITL